MLLETFSGDEEDEPKIKSNLDGVEASSEVKDLLSRKLELEKKNRSQELHQQRVMVSAIFFCFSFQKKHFIFCFGRNRFVSTSVFAGRSLIGCLDAAIRPTRDE